MTLAIFSRVVWARQTCKALVAAYGLDVRRDATTRDGTDELARRIRAEEPEVGNALIEALDDWGHAAKMYRTVPERVCQAETVFLRFFAQR
jgi:hypothetical protein